MPADFASGLFAYEGLSGLVVKVEIIPEDGTTVTVPTKYYINYCTRTVNMDDIPNIGEFNITLNGRFEKMILTEPLGTEDWVKTYA